MKFWAINTHYAITWNNGVWKIFNIHKYEDCEVFNSLDLATKALYA
jgi:hypothetical protein